MWWEEIGRTTLGSAGDTITVSSLPARKYIKIYVILIATAGTITGLMRFNNDSGSNNNRRYSTDGGSDTSELTQTDLLASIGTSATNHFSEHDVINIATQEKLVTSHIISRGTAGAGSATSRRETTGKWVNTSDAITRVDVVNSGTGDYAIGSEVIVLAHN